MYLLKEAAQDVRTIITEEKSGEVPVKKHFIEGVFLQADVKNRNGRVYPAPVMQREVSRYIKEAVESRRAYGELGHPDNPSVNMPLISHMIESLSMSGGNVIGRAKILNTPNGNIVKALLDEGATFGVSSRGLGSLHKQRDGTMVVQEDFTLTAVDIVADPSAPDAFVTGLVENKQWVWENGVITEKQVAAYKKEVLSAPSTELSETFIRVFSDYMSKLAKK